MLIEITKDGVVERVKPRYLSRFLEQGWTEVSNTSPKKVSKAKITATADVIEQSVQVEQVVQEEVLPTNPPINQQGE
jgi:hypothetical protein